MEWMDEKWCCKSRYERSQDLQVPLTGIVTCPSSDSDHWKVDGSPVWVEQSDGGCQIEVHQGDLDVDLGGALKG